MVLPKQENKKQEGVIQLENKSLPVYQGVNTVGRNKGAVINITNLTISQHHALIIIIDTSQHFLSDVNTSNGTFLNKVKLIPLKLYPLRDGAEIKFGDVTAAYKKTKQTIDNTEAFEFSQNATQFYLAETQRITDNTTLTSGLENRKTDDFHEAPTQLIDHMIDFHDAPTQIVSNSKEQIGNSSDSTYDSVHLGETLALDENDPNNLYNTKNAGIADFAMPSELPSFVDNVILEESVLDTDNAKKTEDNLRAIEETILDETAAKEDDTNDETASNSSINFLTMNNHEKESLGSEPETEVDNKDYSVTSKKKTFQSTKLEENYKISDSETDDEKSEAVCFKRRKLRKLSSESVDLEIKENFLKTNVPLNSDSETDIDEENVKKYSKKEIKPKTLSKQINSDSDTDMEENITLESKNPNGTSNLNDSDYIPATQEASTNMFMYKPSNKETQSSDESFRLGITELMNGIENEDLTINQKKSTIEEKTLKNDSNKLNFKSSSKECNLKVIVDCIDNKDHLDQNPKKKNVKKPKKNIIIGSCSNASFENCNIDDDGNVFPAQKNEEKPVDCKKFVFKNKKVQIMDESFMRIVNDKLHGVITESVDEENGKGNESSDINVSTILKTSTENEKQKNDYFATTQKHTLDKSNQKKREVKDKDVYCVPTQKNSLGNTKQNEIEDDSVYLAPTQRIPVIKFDQKEIEEKDDVYFAPTQKVSIVDSNQKEIEEEDDDVYFAPTQKISIVESKQKEIEEKDDDVYFAPTQKISIVEPNQKEIKKKDNDVFFAPTQKNSIAESKQKKIEEKDDFYFAPTQKISVVESNQKEIEEKDNDVFFAPTQKKSVVESNQKEIEEDDVYFAPTQKISIVESKQKEIEERDDDDVYFAPTQKNSIVKSKQKEIEEKDDDVYFAPTQKISVVKSKQKEIEEKDDDVYFAPTQKMSIAEYRNEIGSPHSNSSIKNFDDLNLPTQPTKIKESLSKQLLGQDTSIPLSPNELNCYFDPNQNMYNLPSTSKQVSNLNNTKGLEKHSNTKQICETNINTSSLSLKSKEQINVYDTMTQQVSEEEMGEIFLRQPNLNKKNESPTESQQELSAVVIGKELSFEMRLQNPLLQKLEDKRDPEKSPSSSILESPKGKRSKKSDIKNLKKYISETDETETLSQIENFVKNSEKNKTDEISLETVNLVDEFRIGLVKSYQHPSLRDSETVSQTDKLLGTTINENKEDLVSNDSRNPKIQNIEEPKSLITRTRSKRVNPLDSRLSEPKRAKIKKGKGISLGLAHEELSVEPAYKTRRKTVCINNNNKNSEVVPLKDNQVEYLEKHNSLDFATGKTVSKKNTKTDIVKNCRLSTKEETKHGKTTDSKKISCVGSIEKQASTSKRSRNKSSDSDKTNESQLSIISTSSRRGKGVSTRRETNQCKTTEIKKRSSAGLVKQPTSTSESFRNESSDSIKAGKGQQSNISTSFKRARRVSTKEDTKHNKTTNSKKRLCVGLTEKPASTSNSFRNKSSDSNKTDESVSTPSRRVRRNVSDEMAGLNTSVERSLRKVMPKVVFTMLDSPQLESLIRQLGGSVVDSVESSTVLVTEHIKRSQKLLSAVGLGKPICSPEWIKASKKANEFLDPWEYILTDKEAETKWKFSLKESLNKATGEKLLTNYTFQIAVKQTAEVLKGAIESCGGKCVKRNPGKNTTGHFVIIASQENMGKYSKMKSQNPDLQVVEPEAIFDGVLRQELRLSRHLL